MKKDLLVLGVLALLGAAYPAVFASYLAIPIMFLLFVGWSTAWDILGGWTGQVSLGHAVFVGLGAYCIGIGVSEYAISPFLLIALGAALAAIAALLWGLVTFKLQGVYFAMSTIAVAELFRLFVINEDWLTNGPIGIFVPDIEPLLGFDFLDKITQYYLALAYATGALLVTIVLSRSRLGYQARAVREDEPAAKASGINPMKIKCIAFMISGALTTVGGGIYGLYLSFIEPVVVLELFFSIQIALIAIIGGRGTVWGPAVGALIIVFSSEIFRQYLGQANLLVYGILILFVMLFLPRGIVGTVVYKLGVGKYVRGAKS